MAITLTIELPDELEQKLMVRAKQKQVSPESIVLQSLSQTLNGDRFVALPVLRSRSLRDGVEIQNNKLQSTKALTPEQINEMVFKEFNNQHFKKTFERLWELREIDKDLEEDDEEIFCPSDYAFSSSINLLVELYHLVGESFPLGYGSVDSQGGLNLVWKCKAQDKEIRLHFPYTSENINSSVYFRLNLESRLMEQPSIIELGKLLQWLTTDDNKLASF